MSLSAILFLIIYLTGAILALVKDPAFGVITYVFEYYHHPPLHWWGKPLPDIRWSLIISLITLIAYFIHSGKLQNSFLKASPTKWFILLLAVMSYITFSSAILPENSKHNLDQYFKLVLFYFLIIKTIREPWQYKLFIWVHLLGAFHWGLDVYRHPRLIHGRLEGFGGPDSTNSNYLASHMLTVLPFLGYYFISGKIWEKIGCVVIAPFIVNLIILANSRGSLIGLGAAGCAALILARGKIRINTALALLLGFFALLYLADKRFMERQTTITEYEQDNSATSRLEFWQIALRVIRDHPFGLGGDGFKAVAGHYRQDAEGRAVHNTLLQIGVEWGLLGLLFYIFAFGNVIILLHKMRKSLKTSDKSIWLYYETLAVEVGLVGRFGAALFGAEMYHESFYWLAGLTIVLFNMTHQRNIRNVNANANF